MFRIGLRNMLDRYHRIMHSLNDAEVDLLQVILISVHMFYPIKFSRYSTKTSDRVFG